MTSRTGRKIRTRVADAGTAGFTLLELIASMLVISVVLAMAAPSLRGFFASRKTEDAARRLLATTRYCRTLAISDGRTCRLFLDANAGQWWLGISDGDDRVLESSLGRTFRLPDGVTMELDGVSAADGRAALTFTPGGTCTPAVVRLRGVHDDTWIVSCASATEQFEMTREDGT